MSVWAYVLVGLVMWPVLTVAVWQVNRRVTDLTYSGGSFGDRDAPHTFDAIIGFLAAVAWPITGPVALLVAVVAAVVRLLTNWGYDKS